MHSSRESVCLQLCASVRVCVCMWKGVSVYVAGSLFTCVNAPLLSESHGSSGGLWLSCARVCVRYVLKGDRMLGGVRVHSPPLTSILPLKLSPLWGGSGGPSPLPKCYRFHPRTRTEGFSAQSVLKLLTVPPLCFISSK